MKKLSLLLLASCIFSITITQDPKQDKYEEWCARLHLSPKQNEKLIIYLDDAKENLSFYKQALQEPQYITENKDLAELLQKTKDFISDPVLLKTLSQIGCLIGLEASYYISEEALTADLNRDDQKTIEELTLLFEKIDEAIENCKQCSKLQKK